MSFPWQQDKNQYCINNFNCECIDNGGHYCTKNINHIPPGVIKFKWQVK